MYKNNNKNYHNNNQNYHKNNNSKNRLFMSEIRLLFQDYYKIEIYFKEKNRKKFTQLFRML